MAKAKAVKVHEFTTHSYGCKQCISIDVNKPTTLINCCLVGAPLLRDYLNFIVSPEYRKQQSALKREFKKEADGKIYTTTKAKVKEVMRYK